VACCKRDALGLFGSPNGGKAAEYNDRVRAVMRNFSMVSPKIWTSPRFRKIADVRAKLLFLYLLTNAHQNSIGCYRLPAGYACEDLGWEPEVFRVALRTLVSGGLIELDNETDEVLIDRWFQHCPPTNSKHYQGACRLVEQIEAAALKERATAALRAAWDKGRCDRGSSVDGNDLPANLQRRVQRFSRDS